MLILSSTDQVLQAIHGAHDIALLAYTLPAGRVEDALVEAAHRGAHVTVRLQGQFVKSAAAELSAANAAAIAALRAAGADAREVDLVGSSDAPLHAKAVLADGALYLDDRNWPDDGQDTIVHDTFASDAASIADAVHGHGDPPSPFFAIDKRDSLTLESRLLYGARTGDDVVVESESFGKGEHNKVFWALEHLASQGVHTRLLVASRDLQNNTHERDSLDELQKAGVDIRITDADEKFALVGNRGWLGSTNASAAFDEPDQLDWGARTDQPPIVTHLRAVFEARWSGAQPL